MSGKDMPQVKKVRAFPIPVLFTLGASPPISAKIVKLTPQGFLAETAVASFKVGERVQIQFEIPVTHEVIGEACVIVKHYSHWLEKDGAQVPGFLVEAHFQNISEIGARKVNAFLASLRRQT